MPPFVLRTFPTRAGETFDLVRELLTMVSNANPEPKFDPPRPEHFRVSGEIYKVVIPKRLANRRSRRGKRRRWKKS